MTEREIQIARSRLELDSKRERYLKEADNKHRDALWLAHIDYEGEVLVIEEWYNEESLKTRNEKYKPLALLTD